MWVINVSQANRHSPHLNFDFTNLGSLKHKCLGSILKKRKCKSKIILCPSSLPVFIYVRLWSLSIDLFHRFSTRRCKALNGIQPDAARHYIKSNSGPYLGVFRLSSVSKIKFITNSANWIVH